MFCFFLSFVYVYMCCHFVHLTLRFSHNDFQYWVVPVYVYFLVYSPVPCFVFKLIPKIFFYFHLNSYFSSSFLMDSIDSSNIRRNLLSLWLWLLSLFQIILILWYHFQRRSDKLVYFLEPILEFSMLSWGSESIIKCKNISNHPTWKEVAPILHCCLFQKP